jgi:hypothetical protein
MSTGLSRTIRRVHSYNLRAVTFRHHFCRLEERDGSAAVFLERIFIRNSSSHGLL